jgi:hypothetical protein
MSSYTDFDDLVKLAKYRYATGQTKDLKEILEASKIVILNDLEHSISRVIQAGFTVHDPTTNEEYRKITGE